METIECRQHCGDNNLYIGTISMDVKQPDPPEHFLLFGVAAPTCREGFWKSLLLCYKNLSVRDCAQLRRGPVAHWPATARGALPIVRSLRWKQGGFGDLRLRHF